MENILRIRVHSTVLEIMKQATMFFLKKPYKSKAKEDKYGGIRA